MRTNLFHIVLLSFFLTISIAKSYAQELPTKTISVPAQSQSDSLFVNEITDQKIVDTIKTDSIKPKKAMLEGIVRRTAKDYERNDQKKKLITLYNEAELYYLDIELKAGIIVMDYEKSEVYAGRIKDSTGALVQRPVFKQGTNVIEPDSIRFNFKTQKALVYNSRTQQGDFRVKAEITKRENDSVYFMKGAQFTTAEDIDNPEYYFKTSKVKFVPQKKVVVGPTYMVIADVPTPIALPFAFFPMTETSQSGIILPSYNDSNSRGFSLQNGGYYLALSDNYDLAVLGDYYTNGSYAMRFESSYAWKYRFRGNFQVRFENLINSERGFPDYAKTSIYNIQWSHSQDAKSNPNSRFSASVNLGSSKYFQQSINQLNIGSTLNNSLNSSVSYSKTFQTIPIVNLSLTATHSQNTNTETINMTLPTLQASVDRVFPFAPKDGIKKGFFNNINFQYNLRGENRIQTTDSLFFKPQMFRDMQTAFQHSIPLSTNFKVFKYFSATTTINYNEVWALKTIKKEYDDFTNRDTIVDVKGFDAFRTYSFTTSLGTTVYGTFNRKEGRKLQAIRHVVRPAVSFNYTPSFDQYYESYSSETTGQLETRDYTRFEGGIFGSPGRNYSNTIGLNLSNTLEAKVTDRDTTKVEPRKIMLLNNLNFGTSYNIAADSLPWSPLSVNGGTMLFKDKMNVNFGATLNPYALNNSGQTINRYNIDNGGSLFRLTSANVTIGYSLSSREGETGGKPNNGNSQGARNGGREDDLFGTNTDFSDRRDSQFGDKDEEMPVAGLFEANLPWDMTFAYSLTYGNSRRENEIIGNSMMISSNIDLTPKWRVGVSTGYDFVRQGVTFTQLRFERDLLSWRMDFNWVPFGENANWGFFIGIKSGILSDIKYDKRNAPNRVLQ